MYHPYAEFLSEETSKPSLLLFRNYILLFVYQSVFINYTAEYG